MISCEARNSCNEFSVGNITSMIIVFSVLITGVFLAAFLGATFIDTLSVEDKNYQEKERTITGNEFAKWLWRTQEVFNASQDDIGKKLVDTMAFLHSFQNTSHKSIGQNENLEEATLTKWDNKPGEANLNSHQTKNSSISTGMGWLSEQQLRQRQNVISSIECNWTPNLTTECRELLSQRISRPRKNLDWLIFGDSTMFRLYNYGIRSTFFDTFLQSCTVCKKKR